MSHDVHLVGSVPMANAEAVFRTVSAAFGAKLKRIPDGETGARIDWITWLRPVFADNPAFELSEEIFRLHETAPPIQRYQLRPGRSIEDVKIDNLFYADIAATSAEAIDRLRTAGRHQEARRYAAALGVNLMLNAGWSWLFFRHHRLGASALGAAVLTASSADLAQRAARADRRAGTALSPYPLWCAFATVLATHVWRLNR